MAQAALGRALDAQADLDRELRALQEPLVVLATAYEGVPSELERFENTAGRLLQEAGLALTLRVPETFGAINEPRGSDAPGCVLCKMDKRTGAMPGEAPSVSDLTYSPAQTPAVTMDLPLRRRDGSRRVLSSWHSAAYRARAAGPALSAGLVRLRT